MRQSSDTMMKLTIEADPGQSERVRRGARFRQMTDAERREIVENARRLAMVGCTPTDVTRQLAEQLGGGDLEEPFLNALQLRQNEEKGENADYD